MSYKCQDCKNNNNGWCNIKKFNGLKKKNIENCEDYKGDNTQLQIAKSKDVFEIDHLTITINEESVFIPTHIIKDFMEDKKANKISVTIPN